MHGSTVILRTAAVSLLAAGTLATAPQALAHHTPEPHEEALIDLPVDCGADDRGQFDMQPDLDYPAPPPAAAEPYLAAVGCPKGAPTYDEMTLWYEQGDDAAASTPAKRSRAKRRGCGRRGKPAAKRQKARRCARGRKRD